MSKASVAKTYTESLFDLIAEYRAESGAQPFSMMDIATWAIQNRKWSPQPRSLMRELAKHLSKVAKLRHHTDPQGRSVRTFHAARFERSIASGQRIFDVVWDHILSMSLDHARISFEQRREQLAGGCRSLDRDVRSFNDNNPNASGREVQMSFDFTFEVETRHEQVVEQISSDEPLGNYALGRKKPR
jgi:hypothetical protein